MSHIRYGMAIDLNKCVGCGACALACKAENNTEFKHAESTHNWADFLTFTKGRAEGNVKFKVLPVLCNHCSDARCVKACPVTPKAMFKSPHGITLHNSERCVGCQNCQNACPYSSKDVNEDGVQYSVISFNRFDEDTHSFYKDDTQIIPNCTSSPAETAAGAGATPPDKNEYTHSDYEAVRRSGIVEKCMFCDHRVQKGESPYCVVSCPTGARIFGALDDPESEICQLLIANGYDRLANNSGDMLGSELGTDPKVFYIGSFNPDRSR